MPIYQSVQGKLVPIKPTTFADEGLQERGDIQRMLREQIEVIAADALVIAEEFGDWVESRRRIDLLAVDKAANLIVIELKRDEDGGHMELQALRYAAMVSAMTFDEAVTTYQKYLGTTGQQLDARAQLIDFFEWDDPEAEEFPNDVRLILAAAEFSKEITTTVLWLNERSLNIKCVRLRPYHNAGQLLIDVEQVIPLPEAESYQIRIRDKKVIERAARTQNRDLTRYDVTVGESVFANLPKRRAIYQVIRALYDSGVDPDAIRSAVPWKTTILTPIAGTLTSEPFEKAFAAKLIEDGRQPQTCRYFMDDGDLIHANGKTYAATKMWGERTTAAIDQLLKAFPGHDISYKASS